MKLPTLATVLLVLVVAVPAFAISANGWFPDRCSFGAMFLCNDEWIIRCSDKSTVSFNLTSSVGRRITLDAGSMKSKLANVTCNQIRVNGDKVTYQGVMWDDGQAISIDADCEGFVQQDQCESKNRFYINFTYYDTSAGPAYTKHGSGEIYGQRNGTYNYHMLLLQPQAKQELQLEIVLLIVSVGGIVAALTIVKLKPYRYHIIIVCLILLVILVGIVRFGLLVGPIY